MRIGLKAFLWIALAAAVFAGLAFWQLRHTLPPRPELPGKIERGALEHGGRTRTWIAYLPAKPATHPALVIALHGSMGSGQQARATFGYDFDLLADQQGFVAVYPQGYEGHWNDCKVKGPYSAKRENIDDVGFLRALVDRLVKDHGVDPARVYVTGISNGGSMTLCLALLTPDFARAYAAVVASVPTPENMAATPKNQPVSVLLMNGTDDPINPWQGGDVVPPRTAGRSLAIPTGTSTPRTRSGNSSGRRRSHPPFTGFSAAAYRLSSARFRHMKGSDGNGHGGRG